MIAKNYIQSYWNTLSGSFNLNVASVTKVDFAAGLVECTDITIGSNNYPLGISSGAFPNEQDFTNEIIAAVEAITNADYTILGFSMGVAESIDTLSWEFQGLQLSLSAEDTTAGVITQLPASCVLSFDSNGDKKYLYGILIVQAAEDVAQRIATSTTQRQQFQRQVLGLPE